ncbi:hypothetical protein O2N63_05915 [Aliiroseovarius sp. KMU-50]|uniref:Uncharacterized protein n=1 Tax=Aliiroseovarius salicola TaxID=3009082 RepID=A0ABT4VZE2_9RHOB|nr:hypothetical protein [Aliiroseovarius sp. KMU-50]MDA5093623.1 hypothetical protein [Aliiroseovarius sp. KMU-50]
MISLGRKQNRQELAQMANALPSASCNGVVACQSSTQASALSPRFAVVRRNHNPSPSSPRSRAFGLEPGFFFRPEFGCANPRPLRGAHLVLRRVKRSICVTRTNNQGRKTCKSENLLQDYASRLRWQDASGMISNAPALAQRQAPSLLASQTEMSLPEQPSAPVQGHFATTWAHADRLIHTDTKVVHSAARPSYMPTRGSSSGGFFVANLRGCALHTHEEGTGYVQ